jgi:hypothetical protein
MNKQYILIVIALIAGLFLVATGWMDSDWQLVSYRYSEWHRSIDYWEYNPFLQVNWWIAWQLNLFRIFIGTFLFGFVLSELRWILKNRT